MVIALVAISIAWWIDHNRKPAEKYDVAGPITISYVVRNEGHPNGITRSTIGGAVGINFQGGNLIVYTGKSGKVVVISGASLIECEWTRD